MDDTTILDLDDILPIKRSVASVGRGEWVSVGSLTDVKIDPSMFFKGKGKGKRKESPEAPRLLPGEKPAKLASDGELWEEVRSKTGLKLMLPEGGTDFASYVIQDEARRSF